MKAAHSLQPKDNSSSLTVLRDSAKDRTFLFYRTSANEVQFYRATYSRAVTSENCQLFISPLLTVLQQR